MEKAFTLKQLNLSIKKLVEGIERDFWITAEIAQANLQQHIYLEFVQKEEEQIVAKARAMIWAGQRFTLESTLGSLFYDLLRAGTKVLVKVRVAYHEVHGLSLVIQDLDPNYTLGELEQQRQETIAKLESEELLDKQQQLSFPLVPQRVAILSSPEAAGLNDFEEQLRNNAFGYVFQTALFPTLVQGERAPAEIQKQLKAISLKDFDVVLLLRGGGSRLDLECFNDYGLSKAIAEFPLPVVAGIGHQRDQTVCDLVAFASVKTPTAAAEYLIRYAEVFEASLQESLERTVEMVADLIEQQKMDIREKTFSLQQAATVHLQREKQKLDRIFWSVEQKSHNLLEKAFDSLHYTKREIYNLDPENVLKRGFSLTLHEGKIVKSGEELQAGEKLQTLTASWTIESQVTKTEKRDE